jgi:hypothetical protein
LISKNLFLIALTSELLIFSLHICKVSPRYPYSQTTIIPYFINNEVDKAVLRIYDINGQTKLQIPITNRGKNELILQANTMEAGIYVYSLYCNNIQVDTKIMILTQ